MSGTRRLGATLLLAALVSVGCGKKGPPLPPLVLLPAPPADLSAVRRGPAIEVSFRIPKANTDRSTPADLLRVEVYALTAAGPVAADEVVRRGVRIGSVAVNKPKDPDEPEPEPTAPKPTGLDQDAIATVSETLPGDLDPQATRAYAVVGINMRGRRGAVSPGLEVPLLVSPPAPGRPVVRYDEKAITVSWPVVAPDAGRSAYGYAVYRADTAPAASTTAAGTAPAGGAAPVSSAPAGPPPPAQVKDTSFSDTAIEWGRERCYDVRTVMNVRTVRIESGASPTTCVTLRDTFPPAKPVGLVGVGSEGAISLIWTPSTEADLAGYIVLRAIEPATALTPVLAAPITDTNFRDVVPAGARVTYAVSAVDKAGNRSTPSDTITETAR